VRPKIIQIATRSGFEGPENSDSGRLYVLFDNGVMFSRGIFEGARWKRVDVPVINEEGDRLDE
jgi:hypothetical protein